MILTRISDKRFKFVQVSVLAIFPIVGLQVARLSIFQNQGLVQLAEKQHHIVIQIEPERGQFLDRHGKELAMDLKVPSIYAVPRIMKQKKKMIATLSSVLSLDKAQLEEKLSKNKAFVWLKRRVTQAEADRIIELKNTALGITYEQKRFYPNGELLSNIVGFCNVDNQGIDGLELEYDRYLKGRSGFRSTKRDALGREVIAFDEKLVPAIDGADIILTIDQYIQHLTERSLDAAFRKWKAKGATAVVLNPMTGEILALANRPTFDPNDISSGDPAERRNRSVTDIYEPGSVFKIVTAAAALAEGKVSLTDKFYCENGTWQIRKSRVIHDVHKYGTLTFPEVLQNSSNIGTVKIAMRLGEKPLYEYIKKFGFGERTGIDLPGEVSGILHPLEKWSKISITSVPYGQEVAATPMQMINAISVIANGGKLMRPYIISEILDPNGVALKKKDPAVIRQVVTMEVANQISKLMERVVSDGTGKSARIEGVRVAGKTGTSQKIENGTYSHTKFIGSFVGYAPAEKPMLAMIVAIDEPRGMYYGGVVAAPVFKEVIEGSLKYLGYAQAVSATKTSVQKSRA